MSPASRPARHPAGRAARVLLSSVFGPYARDDEHGSRRINPMELYHNQVTREQGPYSLRMFHRSFGLMLLQANVDAPCTLLDFPTRERFVAELRRGAYDVVGISGILPNVGKVRDMCALVRQHAPRAVVVVGGHVTNRPTLAAEIDADHIVRGDGVRWLRSYLGQDPDAPVRHPLATAGFGARTLGLPLGDDPRDTAAVLLPSVGCPVGCNFCSTSAMFGGKGQFVSFYESGDELFQLMCRIEEGLGARSFFVMDENFLLYRQRALRLLELMEARGKSWSLDVFSSARVLRSYTMDQLVGLGISWVWMGLEGDDSRYPKLRGVDTRALVRELQSHGVRVLGSTIIGLEHHTLDNVDRAIEAAVSHGTEFHQFMLYTPLPGTPLHAEHARAGTLLPEEECPPADVHGQARFNFRHPHLPADCGGELLRRAFQRDFEVNGPSVLRVVRTTLAGWRRYRDHPDPRLRARFEREAGKLATTCAAGVWAARRHLAARQPAAAQALEGLLIELYRELGWKARLAGPTLGRVVQATLRREERASLRGRACEPPTFCERNPEAMALEARGTPAARWVVATAPATARPAEVALAVGPG